MCCDRCIDIVRKLLNEVGYNPVSVAVGEVVIAQSLSPGDLHKIKEKLQSGVWHC